MFISAKKYEKLNDRAKLVDELEKECKRLADLVSAQVEDCKIGVWCKDCKFLGRDKSIVEDTTPTWGLPYPPFIKEYAGEVQYCKKHLCEICPEFEESEESK